MKISEKDKKSLIVLSVFLALAAYYHFLLDPLYKKWNMTGKKLAEKRKELSKMERKIREQASWEEDRQKLLARIWYFNARIKMPALKESFPRKLRAVTRAIDVSGVKVANIRPSAVKPADGTGEATDSFSVEGSGDIRQMVIFWDRLYGMRLDEVTVSDNDDSHRPLKFFVKASAVPSDLNFPQVLAGKGAATMRFAMEGDPFALKESAVAQKKTKKSLPVAVPASVSPSTVDTASVTPAKEFVVAGLRLVGISDIAGSRMAVIEDETQKKELFLFAGDKLREYTVDKITKEEVHFVSETGGSSVIALPRKTDIPRSLGGAKPKQQETVIAAPAGKAHLGLSVKGITSELKAERKLTVSKGLIISKIEKAVPGLAEGDVITAISGVPVESVTDASKILKNVNVGDDVELEILKDGVPSKVTVKAY